MYEAQRNLKKETKRKRKRKAPKYLEIVQHTFKNPQLKEETMGKLENE